MLQSAGTRLERNDDEIARIIAKERKRNLRFSASVPFPAPSPDRHPKPLFSLLYNERL